MLKDLKDKVVVITGASSGFGKALALRLSQENVKLVLLSRNAEKVQDVSQSLLAVGVKVSCFSCDVTDIIQVKNAVNIILEAYGTIDVLINCAAIWLEGTVDAISSEKVKEVFDVNSIGLIYMIQQILPVMRRVKSGHIVTIGSHVGLDPMAGTSAYTASKYAIRGFSESLRMDLAGTGIRVSSIYPGGLDVHLFNTTALTSEKSQALDYAEKISEIVVFMLRQPDDLAVDHIEVRKFIE